MVRRCEEILEPQPVMQYCSVPLERYRSGHNGADSKSDGQQCHVGSNPTLSANNPPIV